MPASNTAFQEDDCEPRLGQIVGLVGGSYSRRFSVQQSTGNLSAHVLRKSANEWKREWSGEAQRERARRVVLERNFRVESETRARSHGAMKERINPGDDPNQPRLLNRIT